MYTEFGILGPYSGADEGYDPVEYEVMSVGHPKINHTMSM
jgi:hypothetical protein